jgi:NAD(P)-dependent dehydrogenase (short-subunit alcohol dehydrogenase family)
MAGRLKGKRALITGGAQGLGEATALKFLEEDAAFVTITDVNAGRLEETRDSLLKSFPGRVHAYTHDVRLEDQWIDVLAKANEAMGGLSILVNSAGIGSLGSVESEDFSTWKRVFEIDVDSIFLGCKYALAYMRPHAPGSIVNISSIAGLIASHNYVSYNAAKAAVWLMSKSIALHCAKHRMDIRCNSVHPTFIKTPILDGIAAQVGKDEAFAKLARQVPIGRLGEPEEVAYMILYLASDESRFVTGAEFKIDGGISAM